MGFFRGLDAEAYDRTYRDRDLVRRMLAYFYPYRRRLLIAIVAILIIAAAGALSPIFVSRSVDLMVARGMERFLALFATILFALGVIVWGSNWIRRRLISNSSVLASR